MSKTKITILTLIVTVTGVGSWKMKTLYADLADRFPLLQPKLRRKAFRKMLVLAVTNQLPDVNNDTADEEMDTIFLEIYESLAK